MRANTWSMTSWGANTLQSHQWSTWVTSTSAISCACSQSMHGSTLRWSMRMQCYTLVKGVTVYCHFQTTSIPSCASLEATTPWQWPKQQRCVKITGMMKSTSIAGVPPTKCRKGRSELSWWKTPILLPRLLQKCAQLALFQSRSSADWVSMIWTNGRISRNSFASLAQKVPAPSSSSMQERRT